MALPAPDREPREKPPLWVIQEAFEGNEPAEQPQDVYILHILRALPPDLVHEGQTIGLIEAMKVFNEVPSPTTGIVRRIVAQNATLVQQGDALMLLEPPE